MMIVSNRWTIAFGTLLVAGLAVVILALRSYEAGAARAQVEQTGLDAFEGVDEPAFRAIQAPGTGPPRSFRSRNRGASLARNAPEPVRRLVQTTQPGWAPELGPMPIGEFPATSEWLAARERLGKVLATQGYHDVQEQRWRAHEEWLRLAHTEGDRRSERESLLSGAQREDYQRLAEIRAEVWKEHGEFADRCVEILAANDLADLWNRAHFHPERYPDAPEQLAEALAAIPEWAPVQQGREAASRDLAALRQQMDDILTGGGADPLLSRADSARKEELHRYKKQLGKEEDAIWHSPEVTAARHALVEIERREVERQQALAQP